MVKEHKEGRWGAKRAWIANGEPMKAALIVVLTICFWLLRLEKTSFKQAKQCAARMPFSDKIKQLDQSKFNSSGGGSRDAAHLFVNRAFIFFTLNCSFSHFDWSLYSSLTCLYIRLTAWQSYSIVQQQNLSHAFLQRQRKGFRVSFEISSQEARNGINNSIQHLWSLSPWYPWKVKKTSYRICILSRKS